MFEKAVVAGVLGWQIVKISTTAESAPYVDMLDMLKDGEILKRSRWLSVSRVARAQPLNGNRRPAAVKEN